MKRKIIFSVLSVICIALSIALVACKEDCKEIELMGAGDRIHDSFTFANNGVNLTNDGNSKFTISGSVDYLSDEAVKDEFDIGEDVYHVVAIKLRNCSSTTVVPAEVQIDINGNRNYDAEHLNGTDYTFIILEAKVGSTTTISVKWNSKAQAKVYTIYMDEDLTLKEKNS